jgi:putative ABC transport system substrate-binding protein
MTNRRSFIAGLGSAAAWPVLSRAQAPVDRMRSATVFIPSDENDRVARARLSWIQGRLTELGWVINKDLQFHVLWAGDDAHEHQEAADKLMDHYPDVILAVGAVAAKLAQQKTQTVPIVVVQAGDLVANGIIQNQSHPGGNVTGVTNLYAPVGGKWVELLKAASPRLTRIALLYNELSMGTFLSPIELAAASHSLKSIRMPFRNLADLEPALRRFATEPNGAAILLPPPPHEEVRRAISQIAISYSLPTVFQGREFLNNGLMSYGPKQADLFRRASGYVDRILRGAKAGELPVEFPTEFELIVNLKTAKAIGLTVPPSLLALADEVIE